MSAASAVPVSESHLVTGPAEVTVPATSANLGPGFDCLGLALDLRDTLRGEVVAEGLEVLVEGEGAAEVARDESHLVVRAMRTAFAAAGVTVPGLRLECHNVIPHGRGLGSSSAAIVGGLVLARALVGDGAQQLPDDMLLRLANRLEGHPDNVAPALLGGLVVSGQDRSGSRSDEGDEVWALRSPVHAAISAVAFVPPYAVRTEVARGLLPAQVAHGEASANTGRAALLVAALAAGPDACALLLRGTEDYLHQSYREPAMPESLALVRALRADGVPAFVSGAGPTVLALLTGPSADALLSRCPATWRAHHLTLDGAGAEVR